MDRKCVRECWSPLTPRPAHLSGVRPDRLRAGAAGDRYLWPGTGGSRKGGPRAKEQGGAGLGRRRLPFRRGERTVRVKLPGRAAEFAVTAEPPRRARRVRPGRRVL